MSERARGGVDARPVLAVDHSVPDLRHEAAAKALARAKDAKGDRAGAIQDLEKAATLNPGNERITSELARLNGA